MLERFRKARTNSDTGEAQARPVEQTPVTDVTPKSIPEGQALRNRILRVLQEAGEPIGLLPIARGSGTSRYLAGRRLQELISEGAVESITREGVQGTKYQIIGRGPNSSKVTDDPFEKVSEEDSIDFVNITNDLVWSFIRATRSTDVLLYLTWLERQGGKDA